MKSDGVVDSPKFLLFALCLVIAMEIQRSSHLSLFHASFFLTSSSSSSSSLFSVDNTRNR